MQMSWRIFTHHTLKTLLRIVQTYKFMAAKEDEDDEL